ncbi:glucose-1-phosphate thymidylyltransferase [Caloranaerobacter ferrireducens]|uniref:glucose-1-phosphate thymidylyltransferase n=1 Tax=Caloranaerobacter ferrireducens TaxID=1323370 RepID=UPI00084D0623|nr:glucose-1-phosphate thymidylyltransferase [Caloranaerobacter ferrireducens]
MKGIILSAGKATRLYPLTKNIPKTTLKVLNKSILERIIDSFIKANIKEIGIVINGKEEKYVDILKSFHHENVNIRFFYQREPLGIAHSVLQVEDFIDKDFVLILGDNIYDIDLKENIRIFYKEKSNSHLIVKKVKQPERFGIIKVLDDKIIDIKEKPKIATSNMAITGLYIFDKSIFKACRSIKPSKRGEYEITDAIKYLIDNNYKVTFSETEKWWMDIGTPDDIFEANKYFLNKINISIEGYVDDNCKIYGKVKIGKNTKLINSYIKGPVFIGKDSFISNCIIEPYTIIGDNVNIENIKVEESSIYDTILLKDSKIHIVKSIVVDNTVYYKTKNNIFNYYYIE